MQQFDFVPEDAEAPMDLNLSITLRPYGPVRLRITPRVVKYAVVPEPADV